MRSSYTSADPAVVGRGLRVSALYTLILMMTLLHETVKDPSQDDDIRKYLGLNLKLLSLIGMEFSLNNDRQIKKTRFRQILPIFTTNVLTLAYAALEVNLIVFVLRGHPEEVAPTKILSELFSNSVCISKSFSIASAIDTIQTVFDEVTILWARYKPNQHCRVEIIEKAQQSLNFCKFYLVITMVGVASYALPPIYYFVDHYYIREANNYTSLYSKRIFLLKYPFEINSTPIFFSALTVEGYLLIMSATYWVSCDALFAQLTTHISLQFQILHYDIRDLINREIIEERLKENIIIFIKRHQGLLRDCRLIEDIFSPAIFGTVLLSSLNICVNIFESKATIAEGNYGRTAMFITMGLTLFIQTLFYCVFAETLTNQTGAIVESVYDCNWTEKHHKLRFYLQMIIMKSQSPFYCTAYGFFQIGHERMASIISASFSYLMMLQSIS